MRANLITRVGGKFGATICHISFYMLVFLGVLKPDLLKFFSAHPPETNLTYFSPTPTSASGFSSTRNILSFLILLVSVLQGTHGISFLKLSLSIRWHLSSSFLHINKNTNIAIECKSDGGAYNYWLDILICLSVFFSSQDKCFEDKEKSRVFWIPWNNFPKCSWFY